MECPKCHGEMKAASYQGIEVDKCSSCSGLWFDMLENADLLALKGGASAVDTGSAASGAKNDTIGKVECPRCHVRMIRMVDAKQSHIWFESCPSCHGTYFDAGEIRDLSEKTLGDLFKSWQRGERKLG